MKNFYIEIRVIINTVMSFMFKCDVIIQFFAIDFVQSITNYILKCYDKVKSLEKTEGGIFNGLWLFNIKRW